MDKLLIEATEDTPKIMFNTTEGIFEISGRSYPDNVFDFYDPLFVLLNNYANQANEKSTLLLKLDYFNTASAKIIYDILSLFDKLYATGSDVAITWCYRDIDEDMKEAGEGFKKIIEVPIELKSY